MLLPTGGFHAPEPHQIDRRRHFLETQMKKTYSLKRFCLFLSAVSFALTASAGTDTYPAKPIHIVVPWSAGTGTDLNARVIGQQITAATGQPVIVENRPGATGVIGTAEVARAPADGYTVLATSNAHIANPFLMKNLPYDPVRDFIPVSGTRKLPSLLVARPGLGVRNLAELSALAKSKPGQITFGAGTSAGRIGVELYQQRAGVELQYVPYKSATAALTDLLGGHVDMMLVDAFNSMHWIKEGKLVALAATGKSRLEVLPNVPTVAESGLPGYDVMSWSGLWVRKGTPPEVIAFLNKFARKAAAAERENVEATGGEVFVTTPEEFSRYVDSEVDLWKRTATLAKIVPQ
jgi:tripartite-type tricarboxylate transporter receptor subunit TctC